MNDIMNENVTYLINKEKSNLLKNLINSSLLTKKEKDNNNNNNDNIIHKKLTYEFSKKIKSQNDNYLINNNIVKKDIKNKYTKENKKIKQPIESAKIDSVNIKYEHDNIKSKNFFAQSIFMCSPEPSSVPLPEFLDSDSDY
jgi:hypothetical protein